jgi:hypothetical protein
VGIAARQTSVQAPKPNAIYLLTRSAEWSLPSRQRVQVEPAWGSLAPHRTVAARPPSADLDSPPRRLRMALYQVREWPGDQITTAIWPARCRCEEVVMDQGAGCRSRRCGV